jgi:Spy/CpxP family protein refolding chaperone
MELTMKPGKLIEAMMTVLVLTLASVAVAAADTATTPPGPQPGVGMMGGYGPASRNGYGPGMMGGYSGGYGPGMMGGYGGGYGPGMMGGYGGGYGSGMMGGYGHGDGLRWGRGYGGPLSQLDLSPDQQQKIGQIQEGARERNWATMGQLRAEQFRLRSLYNAEKPSPDAVADQQKKVDDLRRQLTKARIETHNEIQTVLTKEQRDQLRANPPWWDDDRSVGD